MRPVARRSGHVRDCMFISSARRETLSTPGGGSAMPMNWRRGECVLIRPDGYVGAILTLGTDRTAMLENYLARMGLVPLEEESK